jgi:hypothetical protein
MFSRRELLAASAMGAAIGVSATKAGSFGNPDEPPQGAINANGPGNLVDPGPQNAVIGSQFPSAQSAPATDVGGMPSPGHPSTTPPNAFKMEAGHARLRSTISRSRKRSRASTCA